MTEIPYWYKQNDSEDIWRTEYLLEFPKPDYTLDDFKEALEHISKKYNMGIEADYYAAYPFFLLIYMDRTKVSYKVKDILQQYTPKNFKLYFRHKFFEDDKKEFHYCHHHSMRPLPKLRFKGIKEFVPSPILQIVYGHIK